MAKGSRGGRRGTGGGGGLQIGTATPQQAQKIIQSLADGDTVSYSDFMSLTDDEKADAISTIIGQGIPNFLDDSEFQKILYYTEVDGKPQTASDSALDGMKGTDLFRTVNSYYNARTDVNYTAKEIYNQIVGGDFTMVSGRGGSAYGKGIYFADNYSSSAGYRNSTTPGKSLIMRAKLNSNARVISYSSVQRGLSRERQSGSKLGQVLRRMNTDSAESTYALCKGYNAVDRGGYWVILDRSALTMSTKTKTPTGYNW